MPVRPAPRTLLAGLCALALLLALPAAAPAAGSPPYKLTIGGASVLVAEPVLAGGTLNVSVADAGGTTTFTPAASSFPDLPGQCTSTLTTTTCPTALLETELRMTGAPLEVTLDNVHANARLVGDSTPDALVVEDPWGQVSVAPAAGNDTIVVRGSAASWLGLQLVGLDPGDDRWSIEPNTVSVGGTLALGDGNDTVTSFMQNLSIDAGPGDDTLIGDGAATGTAELRGGDGADAILLRRPNRAASGGAGSDRLSFELASGPLTLTLSNATDVVVQGQPGLKTGFEEFEGTPFNDRLNGRAGADMLFGGGGNDTVVGNGGPDMLDGGPGDDTVDYAWAGSAAVSVRLDLGTATTGELEDVLRSFRGVITANGNDEVTGTAAAETFQLGGGDDVISAGPGADAISAGTGNDTLRGGPGADVLDGGVGGDTVTYDERGPFEPLNITLATAGGDGGAGENDTLAGIEDVIGGASNDVITGDAGGNVLRGGFGLDTLDGGAGGDVLSGGEDRDTIAGGAGTDTLFGEGDDDSINAFDGEVDTVDCGASPDDDAQVDGNDSVTDCEFSRRGDVPVPVDVDGDGFVAGFDCNDANPAINPGATDIVGDGIDQNCDGFDEPVPFVDYGLSLTFSKATARGRKVTRLIVNELPSSHTVRVSCKAPRRFARRCPFTRSSKRPNASGAVTLTSLFRRRVLPPGTAIELQITAPGFNGRVRRFTIRAVGAVRDQRLCLTGTRRTPRPCPAGED